MKKNFGGFICLSLLLLLGVSFNPNREATYQTDAAAASQIGTDLWDAMDPMDQRLFPHDVVAVADDPEPWIKPVVIKNGSDTERCVAISQGFIDLMNNVSHAKAIDKFEPGFFNRYLQQLARESGASPLRNVPNVSERKYWSEELLNEQQSNFNQMVALLLGMHLSHHSLGHYDRYGAQLKHWQRARPINHLVSAREWNNAFQAGLEISLNAGYGVEGFEALCEALERMPRRPPWADFLLPRGINFAQLEQALELSENAFFESF